MARYCWAVAAIDDPALQEGADRLGQGVALFALVEHGLAATSERGYPF